MAFVISSANIQYTDPNAQNTADIRSVAKACGTAGVIGWQEILTPSDLDPIQALRYWKTFTSNTPVSTKNGGGNPFSMRGNKLLSKNYVKLHGGKAGICYAQWIGTAIVNRGGGRKFAFTNRHYVAQAFKESAPNLAERKAMWREGMANDKALIESYIAQGLPVAMVGDYNYYGAEPYGDSIAGKKIRYFKNGLDFVCLINGTTWKWKVYKSWTKELNSDHDALFVKVGLVK